MLYCRGLPYFCVNFDLYFQLSNYRKRIFHSLFNRAESTVLSYLNAVSGQGIGPETPFRVTMQTKSFTVSNVERLDLEMLYFLQLHLQLHPLRRRALDQRRHPNRLHLHRPAQRGRLWLDGL